ncbi:heme lyase CcmF/NrfE family subunit [Conexibacter sp. SYSU D00693]|uniref:heme lyase CcmF/NrfE family subunit n=1 Tax=Conexibacter sp. SYSU D00693 TaxID=2812560 RepID=UPI00196AE052|nr:cytochrome c-type biogenesis CcmF C-terminal domain-containing protein [Conexibacter sp. SYSU D00693]
MADLGRALLVLALAVAVFGAVIAVMAGVRGRRDLALSARRCVYALAALTVASFAILEAAFLRTDLSFSVVASHSSTTTPAFYKATAPWSSQEGSLLLWLLLLSLWSSLVLFLTRRRLRDVQPWATAVLLGLAAFFAGLLVFSANPFTTLATPPAEGAGLNPLLRHPSMMSHPPMLYSGYTLFAIPFAFAVGALIVRRVDAEWIAATRRFALAAWFFLGIGILLGARWSYAELGWGGYWAWDPVENASLMPWLTGTAFIHSLMIQERRGMLKVWNASLALSCGVLSILGTFLVRSGILDSIHAFGASTLGVPFLVLIGVMVAGSIALVVSRLDVLRSEHRLDSLWSREAVFLGNNLVLVGLAFVVFWGTFFPLIAEAVTGTKQALGPPWFDKYIVPLALVLVLLSGIGPLIAWRRGTLANARRSFLWPAVGGVAGGVVAIALGGGGRPLALVMFVLGAFVLAGVWQELWRGVRARRAMSDDGPLRALVALVDRNRRRYGGYLVHVGMAVLFIGVAASSAFQNASDTRLSPGETARVGGYDVRYDEPTSRIDTQGGDVERIVLGAQLTVRKDGEVVARLHPERGYYPSRDAGGLGPVGRFFEGEATSEIAMDAGATKDLWTAVSPDIGKLEPIIAEGDKVFADAADALTPEQQGMALGSALRGLVDRYTDSPPPATFRLIVSPMVTWIWVGGLLVFLGGLIALVPPGGTAPRPVTARLRARVARELAAGA